jgi:hypothetical protein
MHAAVKSFRSDVPLMATGVIMLALFAAVTYFQMHPEYRWGGATVSEKPAVVPKGEFGTLSDTEREVIRDLRNDEVRSLYIRREGKDWRITVRAERRPGKP